jgi:hypothetical protein
MVAAPESGVLMPELSGAGVAAGVERLRAALPERTATRRYAEGFDWDSTTRGQLGIFQQALAPRGEEAPAHA